MLRRCTMVKRSGTWLRCERAIRKLRRSKDGSHSSIRPRTSIIPRFSTHYCRSDISSSVVVAHGKEGVRHAKSDTHARTCFSRPPFKHDQFRQHDNKTCLTIPALRPTQNLLLSCIKASDPAEGGLRSWLYKVTNLYFNRVFDSAAKLVFLSRFNTIFLTQFDNLDKARFPS